MQNARKTNIEPWHNTTQACGMAWYGMAWHECELCMSLTIFQFIFYAKR